MLSPSVKKAVIDRDKKCLKCGATENLTIDHILPLSQGGDNHILNLQTLCETCNKRKGFFTEFTIYKRIMIWLHSGELIQRTRNEIKTLLGAIQSRTDKQEKTLLDLSSKVGALKTADTSGIQSEVRQALSILHLHQDRFTRLETRLQLLEKYLKVELVEGTEEVQRTITETVQVKEFRQLN